MTKIIIIIIIIIAQQGIPAVMYTFATDLQKSSLKFQIISTMHAGGRPNDIAS